ncbi:MAG TPA: phospholipase D family protein [Ktedonobacterales bacterium]|jgi:phosphatidylserine/phosphatidylglycerophosphate/cardiolipin synthase-like enzyme
MRMPTYHAGRIPTNDQADLAWWARGDAPVRVAETVVPLVDGRAAMLAMCAAFLTAKRTIWLADWDLHAELRIVRGRDQRAGPDGSPEQERLLKRLRTAGLDAAAIALWEKGDLRVVDVLGFAAARAVDVRVLLWDPVNPGGRFHITNDTRRQQALLEEHGVQCRLDKSSRSLLHMAQALHQKCSVVDSEVAFVGGVDLTVQYGGDFDRWDTPAHPFDSPIRATELGPAPHPWHDAHMLITGLPAQDVERNISQRWDEAGRGILRRSTPPLRHLALMFLTGGRTHRQLSLRQEERGDLPPGAGPHIPGAAARVQVVRTIPALTYRFAPAGIYGIAQAYTLAVRRSREFIYLESQYLWLEGFTGINVWRFGWQSHQMRALLSELAAAARRGVRIALVLPDHPNCGRAFTDGSIAWLRQHAPDAAKEGRLHFFTLACSSPRESDDMMRYRPIYVHAKVGIVDDRWATVGSANLNSRGMSHDAEINVAVLDHEFARGLRTSLWAEHAGILPHAHTGWPAPGALPLPRPLVTPRGEGLTSLVYPAKDWHHAHEAPPVNPHPDADGELARLEDPETGLALLADRAIANLARMKRGEPLVGQLLPYLDHTEDSTYGLDIDRDCGYLDPRRAERENVSVAHPDRYV